MPGAADAKGDGLAPIMEFRSGEELWSWLNTVDATASPGSVWVRLYKRASRRPSITFDDLLEAGLAHGWSESTRKSFDEISYLQRFSPRRTKGTTSARNLGIIQRLEQEGRMTAAGRAAL
jgi:uncharacterized protein YdeI (YjbR/CyaY-like superfamily)